MALLKCPQCGAVVSSNVDFCPKCGCNMSVNSPMNKTESTGFNAGNQGNSAHYTEPNSSQYEARGNVNYNQNFGPAQNANSYSNKNLVVIIALFEVAVMALVSYLFVSINNQPQKTEVAKIDVEFRDNKSQEKTEEATPAAEDIRSPKDSEVDRNYDNEYSDRSRVNPAKSYEDRSIDVRETEALNITPSKRYYLIVTSLSTKKAAEDFIRDSGNDNLRLLEYDGRHRIYVESSNSLNELKAIKNSPNISRQFPNSWILKIK